MKLKVYLRTKGDIEKQASEYANVFKGEVVKKSFGKQKNANGEFDVTYANVNIANQLTVMIAKYNSNSMPAYGYNQDIIISFDKDESYYNEVYQNLTNSKMFTNDYERKVYH